MSTLLLIALLANPIILEVPGLTCPTCVPPVKKALALLDGVQRVEVDWRARKVTVSIDEKSTVKRAALVERLKSVGFPPTGQTQPSLDKLPPTFGDVLLIKDPPKEPARLSVWGKVTVVAVCTPSCTPCDVFKRDVTLFAQRVSTLAVRMVVVDGPKHPAADYLPARADVPYVYVYDKQGKERYAGGTADQVVYGKVEEILGLKK